MSVTAAPGRFGRLTVALLAGTATLGAFAFLATLFQTPGLEAPVEIAPVAVVTTVISVVALPLVRWGDPLGHAAAILAGAAAAVGVALYVAGAFGPPRVAPGAYLLLVLGLLLVSVSVVASREGAA